MVALSKYLNVYANVYAHAYAHVCICARMHAYAAYARIWTWMWQTGVYKCKYPQLNNTMPVGPECWTWYSKGKRICFYDEQKGEHYETGDELLDFDI